jgi:citrate synthase
MTDPEKSPPSQRDVLRIEDSRTGRSFELPITDDTVPAMGLRDIRLQEEDFGMLSFDPALTNTATCRSSITYIDGEAGILNYRGYPIEQLAENADFLEVIHLLLEGDLPTPSQRDLLESEIQAEVRLPDSSVALIASFPEDAHPMTMLTAAVAGLASEFPDVEKVRDPGNRRAQVLRLLALTPVLAALANRHSAGLPPVLPAEGDSYAGGFLRMLLSNPEGKADIHPALERALDALLVLHADHEQNCSANAVRAVASSLVNPYSAAAAGIAALHGPLHGGANQAVLQMLDEIPSLDDVPAFLDSCKTGERRLMGFGHRVYHNYDPRAKVIRDLAAQVFEIVGDDPKLEIAKALETVALEDDYFISRKLFPNVDFYSGLIYSALGFDPGMFPVFFAVGRMSGWLAHWEEMMAEPFKIVRPRQIYQGPARRDWIPPDERKG